MSVSNYLDFWVCLIFIFFKLKIKLYIISPTISPVLFLIVWMVNKREMGNVVYRQERKNSERGTFYKNTNRPSVLLSGKEVDHFLLLTAGVGSITSHSVNALSDGHHCNHLNYSKL